MKKFKISQKGFTIVEVLVYGVVFSLLLFLITQVFITVRTTSANALAMVNLQQNYARIVFDLNQTLRGATGVVFPSPGDSSVSLSLNDGGIVYQIEDKVLKKVISGSSLDLSDEGVSIPTISFENVGEATQTATIKILMTVESRYVLEGGRTISEDFQTTIGLR